MQLFLIWLLCTFGVPFLTCILEVLHKLFTCSDTEEEMKKTSRKKILDKGTCENEEVDYDELDY